MEGPVEVEGLLSFRVVLGGGGPGVEGFLGALRSCLSRWGLSVVDVEVERWAPPRLEPVGVEGEAVEVVVEHYPTVYVFRGRRVLYPSPARLAYSAFSALARYAGVSVRGFADALALGMELVRVRGLRVGEYSLGRGRRARAFTATATYVASPEVAGYLRLALAAGEALNVGKSRGIGFGALRVVRAPWLPRGAGLAVL